MADVKRINELAAKKRAQGLTDEEEAERKALHRVYVDEVKASLASQLENTYIVENGVKRKIQKNKKS